MLSAAGRGGHYIQGRMAGDPFRDPRCLDKIFLEPFCDEFNTEGSFVQASDLAVPGLTRQVNRLDNPRYLWRPIGPRRDYSIRIVDAWRFLRGALG